MAAGPFGGAGADPASARRPAAAAARAAPAPRARRGGSRCRVRATRHGGGGVATSRAVEQLVALGGRRHRRRPCRGDGCDRDRAVGRRRSSSGSGAACGLVVGWRAAAWPGTAVRSSAVIGAICSVAIVVVTGSTLYESSRAPVEDDVPYLRTDQALVRELATLRRRDDRPARARGRSIESGSRARSGDHPAPHPEAAAPDRGRVSEPRCGRDPAPGGGRLQGRTPWHRGRDRAAAGPLRGAGSAPLGSRSRRGHRRSRSAPAGIRSARIHLPARLRRRSTPSPGPELPFGGSFESPHASQGTNYVLVGPAGLDRAGLGTEPSPNTLIVLPERCPRRGP